MKQEISSFKLVFGNAPYIKVLDFLLMYRDFDYSLTEIAKQADVGWATINQFWKKIVALGIVKKTRRIGRAQMYKLNDENKLVKKLIDIDNHVSKMMMKKELKKQMITIFR